MDGAVAVADAVTLMGDVRSAELIMPPRPPVLVELLAALGNLVRRNRLLATQLSLERVQVERLQRLQKFVSPPIADAVLAGDGRLPCRDRREVTVVFFDLRGFTAFAQTAAPEDVMDVLGDFHAVVGRLARAHRGIIERFTGDGVMVFFDAPPSGRRATESALRMVLAMRDAFPRMAMAWGAKGHDLDLGIGIARGYATVGVIGFEGRYDYGVIGSVTNLAARLCSAADGCRILASSSVVGALGSRVDAEFLGDLSLKGFVIPVATFSVHGLRARGCARLGSSRSRIPSPSK